MRFSYRQHSSRFKPSEVNYLFIYLFKLSAKEAKAAYSQLATFNFFCLNFCNIHTTRICSQNFLSEPQNILGNFKKIVFKNKLFHLVGPLVTCFWLFPMDFNTMRDLSSAHLLACTWYLFHQLGCTLHVHIILSYMHHQKTDTYQAITGGTTEVPIVLNELLLPSLLLHLLPQLLGWSNGDYGRVEVGLDSWKWKLQRRRGRDHGETMDNTTVLQKTESAQVGQGMYFKKNQNSLCNMDRVCTPKKIVKDGHGMYYKKNRVHKMDRVCTLKNKVRKMDRVCTPKIRVCTRWTGCARWTGYVLHKT